MDNRAFDSVIVLSYNFSSPFTSNATTPRANLYGVTGTPTIKADGVVDVNAGSHSSSAYLQLLGPFNQRKVVSSPIEMSISNVYDSVTRQGSATIRIKNVSASAVTAKLYAAINQKHIYYAWQGYDSIPHVVRAMLPDANGEQMTIAAGDSVTRTRDFNLDASWPMRNCEIVAFMQNASTREMYQGAKAAVKPEPYLTFCRYESVYPRPDMDVDLTLSVFNVGTGPAENVAATLSTTDPYVAITGASTSFGAIDGRTAAVAGAPVSFHVSSSCPVPHVVNFTLDLTSSSGGGASQTVPVNITTATGFADDIENGTSGWAHSGLADAWHQTTHRSSSPTHSWYCGLEGSWQYAIETDQRLVSPFFTVGTDAGLSFYHKYASEVDWDYCAVEADNGSDFWRTLALYNGSNATMQQVNLDLSAYTGQTTRLQFRFTSDGSVNAEGWYVDDVRVGTAAGTAAGQDLKVLRLEAGPNPVRSRAEISYQVPTGTASSLVVCDVSGRTIASIGDRLTGTGRASWGLTDGQGRRVSPGTYFVRLTGVGTQAKVIVTE